MSSRSRSNGLRSVCICPVLLGPMFFRMVAPRIRRAPRGPVAAGRLPIRDDRHPPRRTRPCARVGGHARAGVRRRSDDRRIDRPRRPRGSDAPVLHADRRGLGGSRRALRGGRRARGRGMAPAGARPGSGGSERREARRVPRPVTRRRREARRPLGLDRSGDARRARCGTWTRSGSIPTGKARASAAR